MARGDAVKAAAMRAAVDRERLAQQKWEHSPQYLDMQLKERQAAQVRMDAFKARDSAGAYAQLQAQQVEQYKEKAAIDAQTFEKRYTAKDKAEWAKWENVKKQAASNPDFSEDEAQRVQNWAEMKQLGIMPGMVERLSPFPAGEGVGDIQNKDGALFSRKANGEIWQLDFKKTAKGVAQEQELEATKAKAALDDKREERLFEKKESYKDYLSKKEVPDYESEEEGAKRKLTPTEISNEMERRYPSTSMPTPEDVQHARDYLAQMQERWGNTPPPYVLQGIQSAAAIIKDSKERAW